MPVAKAQVSKGKATIKDSAKKQNWGTAFAFFSTSLSIIRHRQGKPKRAAFAQYAVHTNLAVVAPNDLGTDVQAQAQPGILPARIVRTVIAVK